MALPPTRRVSIRPLIPPGNVVLGNQSQFFEVEDVFFQKRIPNKQDRVELLVLLPKQVQLAAQSGELKEDPNNRTEMVIRVVCLL